MPIKVSCTCGAAFAAKDELAGRTVACPKCRQPLTIPRAAPVQRQAPAPQAAPEAPSIFDDAGMKAKQHTGQVCPSCYHPMKPGTIICVHCGYSLQLGRKMEMQVYGREGGHGEAAAVALQRAANTLAEDKREERKKVTEGVPWWAFLIMFTAAVGLLTLMMLLPPKTATVVALMFLGGGGVLMALYAAICMIVVAFRESVVQGFLVMFVPFYFLIFVIMKWDQCGSLFLLGLGGLGILGLAIGVYFALAAGLNTAPGQSLAPRPVIPLVRYSEEPAMRVGRANSPAAAPQAV